MANKTQDLEDKKAQDLREFELAVRPGDFETRLTQSRGAYGFGHGIGRLNWTNPGNDTIIFSITTNEKIEEDGNYPHLRKGNPFEIYRNLREIEFGFQDEEADSVFAWAHETVSYVVVSLSALSREDGKFICQIKGKWSMDEPDGQEDKVA